MIQLLRITATAALALVFAAGTAFAQSNNATVTQDGTDNSASLNQEFTPGGSGVMNTIEAFQDGEGNTIENFTQFGDGNTATIDQIGDNNDVGQNPNQGNKDASFSRSQGGTVDIDQYGDRNDVWDIDQGNTGNVANIYQGGPEAGGEADGNFVDVDLQLDAGGSAGGGNTLQGNTVTITQSTDGNRVGVGRSAVRGVYQWGEGNELTITQKGAAGSDVGTDLSGMYNGRNAVAQEGFGNTATVTQRAGGNHTVEFLIQTGDFNELTIDQFGGSGSVASAVQLNGNNAATITQNGSNNTARVTQQ
jgi:hypothetical protein